MAAMIGNNTYRQSYVEKDRCVRNSTATAVPGVDMMQGFELSKEQFEAVFLQAAEDCDASSAALDSQQQSMTTESDASRAPLSRTNRLNRKERKEARARRKAAAAAAASTPQVNEEVNRPFRGRANALPVFNTPEQAAAHADKCRREGAALQRATPADFERAGQLFERAVDARARHALFCTSENADAHVEYAQNLSKRGLTPEAEYHLRTAADIFRMLDARTARKYGDVLLYTAVVVDRQGRLAEAENFYRSALAVYRANKLSDDNVRVAIDSLSNNLRAQGRGDEVDTLVQRHFLGAAC